MALDFERPVKVTINGHFYRGWIMGMLELFPSVWFRVPLANFGEDVYVDMRAEFSREALQSAQDNDTALVVAWSPKGS